MATKGSMVVTQQPISTSPVITPQPSSSAATTTTTTTTSTADPLPRRSFSFHNTSAKSKQLGIFSSIPLPPPASVLKTDLSAATTTASIIPPTAPSAANSSVITAPTTESLPTRFFGSSVPSVPSSSQSQAQSQATAASFGKAGPSFPPPPPPLSQQHTKKDLFRCLVPCKRRCSRTDEYTGREGASLELDTNVFNKLPFASPPVPGLGDASDTPLGEFLGFHNGIKRPGEHCPSQDSEEACKRSLDHFPLPDLEFPMPALDFDFRIAVTLKPEPSRLEGAKTQKEITVISGGKWSGSMGHGNVVAGGYDLGQARGFRPIRIVEGAFILQTTDETPATLEMRTRGSLSGPSDVLDALLSPRQPKDIDPRRYGFRMFSTIKTADKRYAEIVNCGLWVASGVWKDDEMIIDAYRVT